MAGPHCLVVAQPPLPDDGIDCESCCWLEKMAGLTASNLGIEAEDFGYAPFDLRGGLGRVHQLFGVELPKVIEAMNRELAA